MTTTVLHRPFKQGKTFLDRRNAWQIQREPAKDTRALFDRLTSRKPRDWDDVKVQDFYSLTEIQQKALLSKPIIDMDLEFPYSIFSVNVPSTTEFIIHELSGGRYYYVDTEGYDYPRYIFEIYGFPSNGILQEGGILYDKKEWHVQYYPANEDTRESFNTLVCSGKSSWENVRDVHFDDLTYNQKLSVTNKTIIGIPLNNPLEEFPVKLPLQEFILYNTHNSKYYYVNTDGSNYAKYLFMIEDFPSDGIITHIT